MGERQTVPVLVQEAAANIKIAREREALRNAGLLAGRKITDLVIVTVDNPYVGKHSKPFSEMRDRSWPNVLKVDYVLENDRTVAVRVMGRYPNTMDDFWNQYDVDLVDLESVDTKNEISTGFRYRVNMMGIARMSDSGKLDHLVDQNELDQFNDLIQSIREASYSGTLKTIVHSPLSPSQRSEAQLTV